jgi:hypothetical protein
VKPIQVFEGGERKEPNGGRIYIYIYIYNRGKEICRLKPCGMVLQQGKWK